MPLGTALRARLAPRRHTALLVAIVSTLAVRPLIGDAGPAPAVFGVAILGLLLLALYTIQVDERVEERQLLLAGRRRRNAVAWTLAALAAGERVAALLAPSPGLYVVGLISWILLFCFVTWQVFRAMLRQKEVTADTISISISVYLLLGMTWGLLYSLIFQLDPGAFDLGAAVAPSSGLAQDHQYLFATFAYFSLTTLTTLGYGDIDPVTLQARYAAVVEGITGQFYLAIVVARLVGMHMTRSADRDTRGQP